MRIAICALTLNRPAGVAMLLEHLAHLERPTDVEVEVEVVVVDNDERRSAEGVVEAAGRSMDWPVRYVVEPRRGIAQARNAAVEAALSSNADFVAFIDDDEVPDPAWLAELLRVQSATGADVVTGPVLPVFEQPPTDWVSDGAFFDRPRYATGTAMHYARTGNVLIAAALLRDPFPPFDERFGLSGGEDTHFFMRVWMAGARMVWADDAVVRETVPSSRVSVRWLISRAYRRGNTLSLCLRDLRDSWPNRARRLGAAAVEVVVGVMRLIGSVVGGRHRAVTGLAQVAYGVGLATGLAGVRWEEYRTTHGD